MVFAVVGYILVVVVVAAVDESIVVDWVAFPVNDTARSITTAVTNKNKMLHPMIFDFFVKPVTIIINV